MNGTKTKSTTGGEVVLPCPRQSWSKLCALFSLGFARSDVGLLSIDIHHLKGMNR